MLLTDDDIVGESFYNPMLADVVRDLDARGLLVESDGAQCVFPPGFTNRNGDPLPLIVQKSDEGYGYAATDLAAIRDRVTRLGADRILYVVGAPQAQHFEMCFAVAAMAGWLPAPDAAVHVAFGSVLGADRKMFRTRAGDTVKLVDLLDEAVARADAAIAERDAELSEAERAPVARMLGIGAVKFADLSTDRVKDYVFDWDRMLAFEGSTGPYLQYAHARIRSIFRRAGDQDATTVARGGGPVGRAGRAGPGPGPARVPRRRRCHARGLGPEPAVRLSLRPGLAFTTFFENCPVLAAPRATSCAGAGCASPTSPPASWPRAWTCSGSTRRTRCSGVGALRWTRMGAMRTGSLFGPDATFLGVPAADLDDAASYAGAAAVVVGAPFDGGTSHRPGCRFGPEAIRTTDYLPHDGRRPHLALGVEPLGELGVVDVGDVEMPPGDTELGLGRLEAAVERVAAAGAVPVVLGGDHTIALPDVTGVARARGVGTGVGRCTSTPTPTPVTPSSGSLHGHGTPMRRLIESGAGRGDRFLQIGLRGYWPDEDTLAWMADQRMRSYEMTELTERGLDECLTEAFAIAPTTATPSSSRSTSTSSTRAWPRARARPSPEA